jgi:hypothetical protein
MDFTLGLISGLLIGFRARDGIGIDDEGALLAFADMGPF